METKKNYFIMLMITILQFLSPLYSETSNKLSFENEQTIIEQLLAKKSFSIWKKMYWGKLYPEEKKCFDKIEAEINKDIKKIQYFDLTVLRLADNYWHVQFTYILDNKILTKVGDSEEGYSEYLLSEDKKTIKKMKKIMRKKHPEIMIVFPELTDFQNADPLIQYQIIYRKGKKQYSLVNLENEDTEYFEYSNFIIQLNENAKKTNSSTWEEITGH